MKFSITIPAYKRTYLKECIDSILAQTYTDFELIIVNDASPEDLDSIVNSFSDSRIRYYKNEKNCGAIDVVDNWNICLSYATGDYVICMGDDDRLLPNCLKDYYELINKYPQLGLYHARTEIIDENSDFRDLQDDRCEFESVYSLIWHRWNYRKRSYIGDFLFDIKLLRDRGGFYKLPLAWASDEISAYIAAIPFGVANSNKLMFQYRESSITISRTGNIELKFEALKQEENWLQKFLESKPYNVLDQKYWRLLKNTITTHFIKEKVYALSKEFAWNNFWMLYKISKNNSISLKMFCYSIILSFKNKYA